MADPRQRAGRLAALLLLVGGGRAALSMLLRGPDVSTLRLTAGYVGLALVAWLVPWSRCRRGATLALALAGFVLTGFTTLLGLVPERASAVPLMVVFAWIGACHPRWSSLAVLPGAAMAYAAPVLALGQPLDVRALLVTLAGCVLVAEVIADAVERSVRSTERAERSAVAFGVVARASTDLHDLDHARVLDAVADAVMDLGYDAALLALIDARVGTFRASHVRGVLRGIAGRVFPAEEGMTGEAWRTGAPVVVTDYQRSSLAIPAIRTTGVRASVAIPVYVHGVVLAVLYGASLRRREVHPEEVEALRILAATAGAALENANEFQAERSTAARYARAAVTDPLTGVGNRRRGHEVLAALRGGDTVVMIDLDRFKDVNDRLGHAAGDQVLRALAGHLTTSVREDDRVVRFGGEEFLVVLSGVTREQAEATVARLLDGWRARTPVTTFSAGVAHHHGGPAQRTLEHADQALYDAKAAGRDTWRAWDADVPEGVLRPA